MLVDAEEDKDVRRNDGSAAESKVRVHGPGMPQNVEVQSLDHS